MKRRGRGGGRGRGGYKSWGMGKRGKTGSIFGWGEYASQSSWPSTIKAGEREKSLPNESEKEEGSGSEASTVCHHFSFSFLSSPLFCLFYLFVSPSSLIASTLQIDWLSGKALITGPDLSITAGEPERLTHPAAAAAEEERRRRRRRSFFCLPRMPSD